MADSTITFPSDYNFNGMSEGAAPCPSCEAVGEFDLPEAIGEFDIACHACGEIYEINAAAAIALAAQRQEDKRIALEEEMRLAEEATPSTITCIDCGFEIPVAGDDDDLHCPSCHQDAEINDLSGSRFSGQRPMPAAKNRTAGIVIVSILSVALVASAGMIALGLYFLTLRADSDVTRYIERNILQLTPARFEVASASYEVSETDLGTSLLVTINLSNQGQSEGTPDEMKVVLTDGNGAALVTWPLDTAGQILAPGETIQLYTRLFEPPQDFANLRVFVR